MNGYDLLILTSIILIFSFFRLRRSLDKSIVLGFMFGIFSTVFAYIPISFDPRCDLFSCTILKIFSFPSYLAYFIPVYDLTSGARPNGDPLVVAIMSGIVYAFIVYGLIKVFKKFKN